MSDTNQSTALTVASVVAPGGVMTVEQIKANRALIRDVMKSEMKEGVHFGEIKGTDKPTLFKPGAELLLSLFRVNAIPAVEDLSTPDCIRYRVTMRGVHMGSGVEVGHGVGECSTDEEKYKWRACYNEREWEGTPKDRQRIKYGWNREERKPFETKQIRTNPADAANTVLKMAAKRAKVDLALSVCAASDVYAQDLEDTAKWLHENEVEGDEAPSRKAGSQAPQRRSALQASSGERKESPPQAGKINAGQLAVLKGDIDRCGVGEEEFLKHFAIAKIEDLEFSRLNEALLYCKRVLQG